ncbi:MAG: KH domain-containing protein [Patescibacteria group bacterium]
MKKLLLFLLERIVDNPKEISVLENESENGVVSLSVTVAKEDMGKVIGKEGKTIRAIRDVVKILALKQNKYVEVVLSE